MALEKEDKQQRYQIIRKTTLVGALVNIVLATLQLVGGFFAHSQALLADGLHTLSDLASDFIVLFAAKIASKGADEDHHYGHGRFETLATVILGLILSLVAVGIASTAIDRFFFSTQVQVIPETIALVFAALAILSKEGLYHYTVLKARQINSDLLKANAWHHRSDAISSIMVFVGLLGAIVFQIAWLDALAALLVSIMIFVMGIKLVINSVNELLDSAVDTQTVNTMRIAIIQLEGVNSVHMLRTRMLAGRIYADVHIQVDSYISVSEGHLIADRVIDCLSEQFSEMEDITVHIDPEDDEASSANTHLASRKNIEAEIQILLEKFHLIDSFVKMQLHYLDAHIEIEVFVNNEKLNAKTQIEPFYQACKAITNVSAIHLHQQL